MLIDKLKYIYSNFSEVDELVSYRILRSGHINDTYLIKTSNNNSFILQRINQNVFKDVPGLINNKVAISKHLKIKFSSLSKNELERKVLSFVNTKKDKYYFIDEDGNYWNVMVFINDSITFEKVENIEIAYEGGKLMGDFLNLTSDFDTAKLSVVIPKFHDMSFRFSQFEDALEQASSERKIQAKGNIEFILSLKNEMHIIENLKERGEIPIRVTHNDTKISNILFDKNNQGLCVIDTDTIMPGIVHYDFGDAIRTICNSALEDEKDLSIVNFNIDYYNAYKKGFLETMKGALSPLEIKLLPLGAKTMIFIMGLRFLTDYLNGDIYYKTTYAEHNLDRAKNQQKLIESFTEKMKL